MTGDDLGDLASVVGGRLREQRVQRGESLRETADQAGISHAHLSDIENGKSHPSLAVLVRLCRALHLPIAELLPRLGGPRIRRATATSARPGVERISHDGLELRVDRVVLASGGTFTVGVAPGDDVAVFVVDGDGDAVVAATRYHLERHDTLDAERADAITLSSEGGMSALVVHAARH